MKSMTNEINLQSSMYPSYGSQLMLLLALVGFFLFASQQDGHAQEMRVNGHVIIAGSGASLPGFGFGAEAPIGKLFSTGIDVNYGMHRIGAAVLVKPSLNFYFSKKQTGIFIGPTLNYYSLINKKSVDGERPAGSSMYGFGFNFGGKGNLSEKMNMHVVLSPQGSIGPFNGVKFSASIQMGIGFKI